MRYIKKFNTVHKSKGFIFDDTNTPNVCLITELADSNPLSFKKAMPPHDYSADYFTIKVEETRKFHFAPNAGTISYSLDYGETWSEPSNDVTTPLIEAGDKILLKGDINYTTQTEDYWGDTIQIQSPTLFYTTSSGGSDSGAGGGSDSDAGGGSDTGTDDSGPDPDLLGKYSVEGNLMSLFYGDNFNTVGATAVGIDITEENDEENPQEAHVPGYDLNNCIFRDFEYNGFDGPFSGIFSYGEYATNNELLNASHLILPSIILCNRAYSGMFYNCTSLTTAPALPAYNLEEWCYSSMFAGCTSLATAPALPTTGVKKYCYRYMFKDCTSLTTAPVLPAQILAWNCYDYMFQGCSSLNYIKCLAVNANPSGEGYNQHTYVKDWVTGVAAEGTFIMSENSLWPEGAIPNGWTIQTV